MSSNAASWWSIPSVLAHQGGWDEILLVAGPILLVVGMLWLAKRRVNQSPVRRDADPQQPGTRSMAAPTERKRPTKSS